MTHRTSLVPMSISSAYPGSDMDKKLSAMVASCFKGGKLPYSKVVVLTVVAEPEEEKEDLPKWAVGEDGMADHNFPPVHLYLA